LGVGKFGTLISIIVALELDQTLVGHEHAGAAERTF
jgi:hypothetical protein